MALSLSGKVFLLKRIKIECVSGNRINPVKKTNYHVVFVGGLDFNISFINI